MSLKNALTSARLSSSRLPYPLSFVPKEGERDLGFVDFFAFLIRRWECKRGNPGSSSTESPEFPNADKERGMDLLLIIRAGRNSGVVDCTDSENDGRSVTISVLSCFLIVCDDVDREVTRSTDLHLMLITAGSVFAEEFGMVRGMDPDLDDLYAALSFESPTASEVDREREKPLAEGDRDLPFLPAPDLPLFATADSGRTDGIEESRGTKSDLVGLETEPSFGGPLSMTGDFEREIDVDRDLCRLPGPDLSFVTTTDSDVADELVKSRDMERDLDDLATRYSVGGPNATEGEGEREGDVTDIVRDLSFLPETDLSFVTTTDSMVTNEFGLPRDM